VKKVFRNALALALVLCMLPLSVFAAVDYNLGTTNCNYYKLISKTDYNLAPGAIESEIIINDETGNNRNVIHAIEVDLTNPNISVMPTSKNISETVDYTDTDNWGIQTMTEQAAHVENDLGLNVVGGMNCSLSWSFTHPYGLLIYNGKVLCDNRASCDTCGAGHPGGGYLAITKDGKAELRDKNAPLTGDEWMAQTVCFNYLVRDGVNLHPTEDHKSDRAPRSVIGIKADGKLVLMMNDGRQAPYSAGFTNHEMAETMIALGCVDAINCDGGGSSTFLSEREGTNASTMKSSPSDGSERSTLSGILVISKATRDGKFDHLSLEVSDPYVTPGSTVTFTATGADSAGGPAEIPADVTWQLKDASMGTVENGKFISNGTVGEAVIQAVYNGNVVGEGTVNVVIPESISFVMANITAPFGKSVTLDVTAKYGYADVTLKPEDVTFTLSDNALGSIDGIKFTAPKESEVVSGTVTATLVHNPQITASAGLMLGKGSEIVYDFEEGPEAIANWTLAYKGVYTPDKYFFNDELSVCTKEDGKVRNGNYAFKYKSTSNSITCMNWCQSKLQGWSLDLTDAVSVSFWMYIPEGSHGYEWDFGSAIPVVLGHEFKYGTGWQYFTVPVKDIGANVTSLNEVRLYRSDTNNTADGYYHNERPNYYADVTYYIDDITINYSSAVEDFDAPIISNVQVGHSMIDTPIEINGQTISENVVSFVANARDAMDKTNYTGLDATSAKMYVDGVEIPSTCSSAGYIASNNVTLANGVHTVRVEISDNNGNTSYQERTLTIENSANTLDTIHYVKADETLENVGIGSLVWMNLVSDNIENVDVITTTFELDNNNTWELDHMVLANGFSAEYTIDPETNDATITITRENPTAQTGEAVVASLPIRVWIPEFINTTGSEDYKSYRLVSVMTGVEMGHLTCTDGNEATFASEILTTSTEYNSTRLTSTFDKEGWHVHEEVALEDKAATCTEDGYTGRTFCNDCNSIITWGETLEATGHNYTVVGGQNVCANCGETGSTANGWIEDENGWKYYLEGQPVYGWVNLEDGWHYFHSNGYAAKGTVTMNGIDYKFKGEKGLSEGGWKYTEDGNMFYYCHRYYKQTWAEINGDTYYFDYRGICATGITTIDTEAYEFSEDGKLIRAIDGVFLYDDYYYYAIDGKIQYDTGLIKWNDDYYYVRLNGRLITWAITISEDKANGLLPEGDYAFGADAKMILKNGPALDDYGNLCFFINGQQQYGIGMVEWKGDFYFVRTNGKLLTYERTIAESETNGLIPAGTYPFGEDGKMVLPKGTWFYDVETEKMVDSLENVNYLQAKVTFEGIETGTATVLAAHYDKTTNALLEMEFIDAQVVTTEGANTTYNTPTMTVGESETIKIYVWNSTGELTPVMSTPAVISK